MNKAGWQVSVAAVLVACSVVTAAPAEETSSPQPAATQSPAAPDALQSLEWLLGEWTGLTDDAVVLVSAHWTNGGAFIEREVIVRREGHDDVGGTQRIGWDPLAGKIKCWSFDSFGGFGEGYWRQEGNQWVVESREVLPDGCQSTTETLFTPQDAGRFRWEVESAQVDGVSLPKQQIEFVRAAQE